MHIDQGLFRLDLTDHHAVLGVPIEADAQQVRKQYLRIARKLHPDSLREASSEQKQQASELLSKLVNPAYEILTQEKLTVEHGILLKLKGQQLQQQPALLNLSTARAKSLVGSNNIDYAYLNALKELVPNQYDSLDQAPSIIGQISELNAAYVMVKVGNAASTPMGQNMSSSSSSTLSAPSGGAASQSTQEEKVVSPKRRREMVIDSYVQRAKEFQYKGNFSKAVIEMREAVKEHPSSAHCHSHLANAYFKAAQTKMASIHCKRALEIDPNDPMAKEVNEKLKKQNPPASAPTVSGSSNKPKDSKPKDSGSGLFGGMFGGKKSK